MSAVVGITTATAGLVMIVAALSKVDGWLSWRRTTRNWFGSGRRGRITTYAIPTSEATAGVAAIVAPAIGMTLIASLLCAFSVGAYILSRKHYGESCNCFGALMPSKLGRELVMRNVFAALVAIALASLAWSNDVDAASPRAVFLIVFSGVLGLTVAEYRIMRRHAEGRRIALEES